MLLPLVEYLTVDRVSIEADLKSRDDVLQRLARLLCQSKDAEPALRNNQEGVLSEIKKREVLGSTGIGGGIALPHIYLDVEKLYVAMVRTEKGVDFNALDEQPCRVFLLIIASKDHRQQYIQLLSQISRLMKVPSTREAILKAKSEPEIIRIIRDACS